MLRRKLLMRMGTLILGFVAGAVVAIVLLQGVLRDLDRMTADAALLMDGSVELNDALAAIELQAGLVASGGAPDAQAVAGDAARVSRALHRMAEHQLMRQSGDGAAQYERVATLARLYVAASSAMSSAGAARELQASFPELRREAALLARGARAQVAAEQQAVSRDLRLLVIGLTLAALVMVNIAVFVLLRTGQMILRPVEALVQGSRELARERFDHRVRLPQRDEFGELAHAYNRLAEELQANEARKLEVLQQLAVTLNHELNNVISVIELQLGLLDRRSGGNPAQGVHLRGIRDNLARMSRTIAALKDVRRIVLTDYVPGQKMIDLPRSANARPAGTGGVPDSASAAGVAM